MTSWIVAKVSQIKDLAVTFYEEGSSQLKSNYLRPAQYEAKFLDTDGY
jgi:hypothetical protein